MTVVGISMVKDEADIIEPVLRHMATQVDIILVADNLSTDSTPDILRALSHELCINVELDSDPAYYQSTKMSYLARMAAQRYGATWVVPFDADEIWYSNTNPRIADHLNQLDDPVSFCHAALYDHVASADDLPNLDPTRSIIYRRLILAELPKVAARPIQHVVIEQGNHGAHYPSVRSGDLCIRHFPYRSPDQMVCKARNGAAAYEATDLPESRGAHWRQYGQLLRALGPEAIHEVFRTWFWSADPANDSSLVRDPAPVQP